MRGKSLIIIAALGLALVMISPSILAEQTAEKPAQSKKQKSEVVGKAKYIKTIWGEKRIVLMKGDVSFTHDDTIITSSQVDYDDTAKIAVSPGALKITNPECDISGDKGSANFKKKLGVTEGNVVMQLKPKPEDTKPNADKNTADKFKQPTTITCSHMEYFYAKKLVSADGDVVFKQTKRTAYADKAVFDQTKELLTLTGNVHGNDEDGQTFSSKDKVIISIKKGDEWMEAPNASASFKIDLDE